MMSKIKQKKIFDRQKIKIFKYKNHFLKTNLKKNRLVEYLLIVFFYINFLKLKFSLNRNKEVFILSNAPRVKKFLDKRKKIKFKKIQCIILNNGYLLKKKYKFIDDLFLVVCDPLYIFQYMKNIEKSYKGKIFFPYIYNFLIKRKNKNFFYYSLKKRKNINPNFFLGIDDYGSVMFIAIQIALLLGFKKINVVGFDMSFKLNKLKKIDDIIYYTKSSNHFDKNYRKKETLWYEPNLKKILNFKKIFRKKYKLNYL